MFKKLASVSVFGSGLTQLGVASAHTGPGAHGAEQSMTMGEWLVHAYTSNGHALVAALAGVSIAVCIVAVCSIRAAKKSKEER